MGPPSGDRRRPLRPVSRAVSNPFADVAVPVPLRRTFHYAVPPELDAAAMVGARGKLFGVQLNDGYTRLGAEDGLAFGSVHPLLALEFIATLQKYNYDGHLYFDTFPRNEDPVRECEYNIRRCEALWAAAERLRAEGALDALTARQDAMGVLELIERVGLP